jgi:hypothetical protein
MAFLHAGVRGHPAMGNFKGIPPSLEIINFLAFRTFEIFEIFIIIRLILNGSGSNAIDFLAAIAG